MPPTRARTVFCGTEDGGALLAHADQVSQEQLIDRAGSRTPDEAINIQYTSGTTGRPKGATLSHRNILNNGYFTTELINFTHEDRLVIPVPFYHCFGMVMANLGCVSHGATMIIPSPAFDPAVTLAAISSEEHTSELQSLMRISYAVF